MQVDGVSFEDLLHYPPALLFWRASSSSPWHGASALAFTFTALHTLPGAEMGSNVALGSWPWSPSDI